MKENPPSTLNPTYNVVSMEPLVGSELGTVQVVFTKLLGLERPPAYVHKMLPSVEAANDVIYFWTHVTLANQELLTQRDNTFLLSTLVRTAARFGKQIPESYLPDTGTQISPVLRLTVFSPDGAGTSNLNIRNVMTILLHDLNDTLLDAIPVALPITIILTQPCQ